MNGGESRAFSAEQFESYCNFINEVSKTAIIVGNVSVPSIPAGFRVMIATLKIDAADLFPTQWVPDDKVVEYNAKPIWGWTATVFDQIARAAGVRWDPDRCHQLDDGSDPNRFEYQVEGEAFDLCGRKISVAGKYEIDFGEFRAEEYQKACDAWDKSIGQYKNPPRTALPGEDREHYANRKADAAERAARKVKLRRGETGARNRAVAKAYGLRRGGWVKNDVLAKVLLVARLEPIIDFAANPEIGRALAYDTLGILGTLAKTGQGETLRMLIMGAGTREERPALEIKRGPVVLRLPPAETVDDVGADDVADEDVAHDQHEIERESVTREDERVIEHVEKKTEPIVVEKKEPEKHVESAKVVEKLEQQKEPAKKSDAPRQLAPDVESFMAFPIEEKREWLEELIDRKKKFQGDRIRKADVVNLPGGLCNELYKTLFDRENK